MMNPEIQFHDPETGETIRRTMTDEEYAEMCAAGWPVETDKDGIPK